MVDININLPYLGGALFFVIMFIASLKLKEQLAVDQPPCRAAEQKDYGAGTNI